MLEAVALTSTASMLPDLLLAQSFAELADDFDLLLVLTRDLDAVLAKAANGTPDAAGQLLSEESRLARARSGELARRLLGRKELARSGRTRTLFDELRVELGVARSVIRTQQAVAAVLATAADWQSPPFLAATTPVSGEVTPHWDDYKRDRHRQAAEYESAYVRELVDAAGDWRALLTGSGMAALTTVIALLRRDGSVARGVVAGAALYHETKVLLAAETATQVTYADETLGELARVIGATHPGAVFVDSLCNTRWAPLPDLRGVVDACAAAGATIVIDNTGLSTAAQPVALLRDANVRGIVVESLLKYQQLGLDRANAGVIVAAPDDAAALDRVREHLGTNVPDVTAEMLPRPRRHVLDRRLARIGRNASLLARRLERERARGVPIEAIVHPSLPAHPAHANARLLPFGGGCVTVVLRDPQQEAAFASAAVDEARTRGVELVGGASFGFDSTRVYVTGGAANADPFLRIAAGAETRLEADLVADSLAAAAAAAL